MTLKAGYYACARMHGEEGAVHIGELTDSEKEIFYRMYPERYQGLIALSVKLVDSHKIPESETPRVIQLVMKLQDIIRRYKNHYTHEREYVLNCLESALRLANDIRKETGNESKNVDNIFEAATAEYDALYSLPSDSVGVTALNVNDINADTRTDRIVDAIKETTAVIKESKPGASKLTGRKNEVNYDKIVREVFSERPEVKTFTSKRLLLYLKDFGRQCDVDIDITESRLRQLPVWKENRIHRQSGKTQNWEDMGGAIDNDADNVNDVDYD